MNSFCIYDSEPIIYRCNGCKHISKIYGYGTDKYICCLYRCPLIQFSYDGSCEDYIPSTKRELILIIENILLKKRENCVEEVDGNCEEESE